MLLNNLLISVFLLVAICPSRLSINSEHLQNGLKRSLLQAQAFGQSQSDVRTDAERAEDYFKIGVAHNEEKRWEEAVKAFKEVIRLKPNYSEAHYKLGVALYSLDRFEEAVSQFQTAISYKKEYPNAYYNLGQSLRKLARWTEAISIYKQGLSYNPKDADMSFGIGRAYDDLEQYEEAASFYKQAIALKPDHEVAHLHLGLIYDNSGRHEEAVTEYKKALSAKSDYADAYNNLGVAFANLGRWSECIEAYANAVRYYPYQLRFRPYFARAYANLSLGDGKAAAADARSYIRLKGWSGDDVLYMAIVAHFGYRQSKAASEATNILNEAVREHKRTSWPYPLIQYLRHELTAQELLTRAANDGTMIEGKTYLGLDSSLADRRVDAIAYLKWVKEKKRTKGYLNEYRLALAELNRIER